jgi:hypothetical protein
VRGRNDWIINVKVDSKNLQRVTFRKHKWHTNLIYLHNTNFKLNTLIANENTYINNIIPNLSRLNNKRSWLAG